MHLQPLEARRTRALSSNLRASSSSASPGVNAPFPPDLSCGEVLGEIVEIEQRIARGGEHGLKPGTVYHDVTVVIPLDIDDESAKQESKEEQEK